MIRDRIHLIDTIGVVSLLAVGLVFLAGCRSDKMTDKFFGLRLNEHYTPLGAIDILQQNTGKAFTIKSDNPYKIEGHDISFAGHLWDDVFYTFDYKGNLQEVHFQQNYFAPKGNGSYEYVLKQTKELYNRMLKSLEAKYGKETDNYNEWWIKEWRFRNKVVQVSMSVMSDTGTIYHQGEVNVGYVGIVYHDDDADATSADVL